MFYLWYQDNCRCTGLLLSTTWTIVDMRFHPVLPQCQHWMIETWWNPADHHIFWCKHFGLTPIEYWFSKFISLAGPRPWKHSQGRATNPAAVGTEITHKWSHFWKSQLWKLYHLWIAAMFAQDDELLFNIQLTSNIYGPFPTSAWTWTKYQPCWSEIRELLTILKHVKPHC